MLTQHIDGKHVSQVRSSYPPTQPSLMHISSLLCCLRNIHHDNDPIRNPSNDSAGGAGKSAASKKLSKPEPYSEDRAKELFRKYEDEDTPGEIGPEGFERLCTDLEISLEGALPLVLAWQMHATEMAKFKESEWMQGCKELL